MRTLATVVDTKALLKTVAASLVAGVGVTAMYAVAIFGATRFAELRRDERVAAAAAAGFLAVIALVTCVAAIALGIVIMTQK